MVFLSLPFPPWCCKIRKKVAHPSRCLRSARPNEVEILNFLQANFLETPWKNFPTHVMMQPRCSNNRVIPRNDVKNDLVEQVPWGGCDSWVTHGYWNLVRYGGLRGSKVGNRERSNATGAGEKKEGARDSLPTSTLVICGVDWGKYPGYPGEFEWWMMCDTFMPTWKMFCFQSLEWLNPLKSSKAIWVFLLSWSNATAEVDGPYLMSAKHPTEKDALRCVSPRGWGLSHWAPFSVHCKHPCNLEFVQGRNKTECMRIPERSTILKNPQEYLGTLWHRKHEAVILWRT